MNDRGTSVVEMAIVLPFLLMVVFGLIDVGRAVYTHLAIEEAAQEGSMFASYHGGDMGDSWTQVVDAVVLSTDSVVIDVSDVTVECLAKDLAEQLTEFPTATVTIRHSLPVLTPVVSAWFPGGISLEASASGTVFTEICFPTPPPVP